MLYKIFHAEETISPGDDTSIKKLIDFLFSPSKVFSADQSPA